MPYFLMPAPMRFHDNQWLLGLFADRLRKEAGADAASQVRLALQLATTRPPSAGEVQRGVDLIETLKAKDGVPPDAALKIFCLLVLNLNEFVYLD